MSKRERKPARRKGLRAVPAPVELRFERQMTKHLGELVDLLKEHRLEALYVVSKERDPGAARGTFCYRRAGISDVDASWGLVSGLLSVHLERMPE